jgi:hypothetical protein
MAGRATVRFTSEELFVVGVLFSGTVLFFVATSGVLFGRIVSFVKAMGYIWGVSDVLFPVLFPMVLFIISEELFVVGVINRAVLFFVATSGVLFS